PLSYDQSADEGSPSKGLIVLASFWDSHTVVQRLPLNRAKIVFDVSRGCGRLRARAAACVCRGNACPQQHRPYGCFHSHVGDYRTNDNSWSVLPRSVYPSHLLRVHGSAGVYSATCAPAGFLSVCLFNLYHGRSLPFGPGCILD